MAIIYADRVWQTTTTTGTGLLTLDPSPLSFRTFLAAIGSANQTYYTIEDLTSGDWEVGLGTVGVGTLTRDSVLASSNSNALVPLVSGTKNVYAVSPSTFYTGALSSASHSSLDHTGLPGVSSFTSSVHGSTNHTGITGVGISTGDHALLNHALLPGVAPLMNQKTNIMVLYSTTPTVYTVPAGTLAADGDTLDIEIVSEDATTSSVHPAFAFGSGSVVLGLTSPYHGVLLCLVRLRRVAYDTVRAIVMATYMSGTLIDRTTQAIAQNVIVGDLALPQNFGAGMTGGGGGDYYHITGVRVLKLPTV